MIRIVTGLALAAAVAIPAFAADDSKLGPRNDPSRAKSGATTQALGGASAPYARVALLYDFLDGPIHSKGVNRFRRVATGHYCIRPSSLSSDTIARIVPSVSVDYSGSSGRALIATYRSLSTLCSSTEIAVQTLRGDDGTFDASNNVGFTLVVP